MCLHHIVFQDATKAIVSLRAHMAGRSTAILASIGPREEDTDQNQDKDQSDQPIQRRGMLQKQTAKHEIAIWRLSPLLQSKNTFLTV